MRGRAIFAILVAVTLTASVAVVLLKPTAVIDTPGEEIVVTSVHRCGADVTDSLDREALIALLGTYEKKNNASSIKPYSADEVWTIDLMQKLEPLHIVVWADKAVSYVSADKTSYTLIGGEALFSELDALI